MHWIINHIYFNVLCFTCNLHVIALHHVYLTILFVLFFVRVKQNTWYKITIKRQNKGIVVVVVVVIIIIIIINENGQRV